MILATLIYFYYNAGAETQKTGEAAREADISEEEIIERARGLGMLFYMDFIRAGGETETDGEPETNEVIIYETVKEELSDIEIIARALELGMDFPEEIAGEEPETETINDDKSESDIDADTKIDADSSLDEAHVSENGDITINIANGMNASEISRILFENNILTDPKDFVDFLVEKDMTGKLLCGSHTFQPGLDYEQILAVLRGKKG